MYKRLLVVSDTPAYRDGDNFFGLAPVVFELESLADRFEQIIWVAYDCSERKGDPTLLPVDSSKVRVVLVPNVGGGTLINNLKTLLLYPYFVYLILKFGKLAEVIHTRAPSHPAFAANILSFFMKRKIWWQKFAGSWDPQTLPWFYKIQRNFLILSKHSKVTINGFWENQPPHCLSFENPCLTDSDLESGRKIEEKKLFKAPFVFIFIGRLDEYKGVDRIIEALNSIPFGSIKEVHFIGDGPKLGFYKQQTDFLKDKVKYHGFLGKAQVHHFLKTSHFLLLPSVSEGFPKVIAEAACYGVIPVVSNVGSIPHYINESNGYIWDIKGSKDFDQVLLEVFENNSTDDLKEKSKNILKLASDFSFENYFKKLEMNIFS